LKHDKHALRALLQDSDMKRHEYRNFNVVAKFVPKAIYEWDEQSLIEYLMDHLVPEVYLDCLAIDHKQAASIPDWEAFSKPFKQPPGHYVKLNLNDTGKQLTRVDGEHPAQSEPELLNDINALLKERTTLENHFNLLKEQLLQSNTLHEHRCLPHKYGSVSLLETKPAYDLHRLLDVFGERFFLDYGCINKQKIKELVQQGFIPNETLETFRTLTDIRLDFTVMTLDTERRMLQGMKIKG